MILFFGIALGFGLGYLLSNLFHIKSVFLIYAAAIIIVMLVFTGITLLHVKFGVYEMPTYFKTVRELKEAFQREPTFRDRLANSLSVTLAWFLLGYLALGASFVWFQLKKRMPVSSID